MDAPSIVLPYCAVCGRSDRVEQHHVVFRSQGGKDGPVISLCGFGNNLGNLTGRRYCHGLAHHRMLHFKYEDGGWWYLRTEEPTKYYKALEMPGWRKLGAF